MNAITLITLKKQKTKKRKQFVTEEKASGNKCEGVDMRLINSKRYQKVLPHTLPFLSCMYMNH